MAPFGRGIVNIGAGVASSGDDDDLVELAEEQDRVEKGEYLGNETRTLRLERNGSGEVVWERKLLGRGTRRRGRGKWPRRKDWCLASQPEGSHRLQRKHGEWRE